MRTPSDAHAAAPSAAAGSGGISPPAAPLRASAEPRRRRPPRAPPRPACVSAGARSVKSPSTPRAKTSRKRQRGGQRADAGEHAGRVEARRASEQQRRRFSRRKASCARPARAHRSCAVFPLPLLAPAAAHASSAAAHSAAALARGPSSWPAASRVPRHVPPRLRGRHAPRARQRSSAPPPCAPRNASAMGAPRLPNGTGRAQQQRQRGHEVDLRHVGGAAGPRRRRRLPARPASERRRPGVQEQRGAHLVVRLPAVVALGVHAVVAQHDEQRALVQGGHGPAHQRVRLRELGAHGRVVRPVAVAGVVDAEQVRHQHVPPPAGRRRGEEREEGALDGLVDRVQVPHVERVHRPRQVRVEQPAGEEGGPGVVAEHGDGAPARVQLGDEVVFVNGGAAEVAAGVDEGRQRARGQGLEPLERRGRGVGDEGQQDGVLGPRDGRVVQRGEGVVVLRRSGARGGGGEGHGEVVAQGVDDDDECAVEGAAVPAAGGRGAQLLGVVERYGRRGAFRLVVQDEAGEEEAVGEEVEAEEMQRPVSPLDLGLWLRSVRT